MNPEKFKRAIAIAKDAIKGIEDKEIKLKTYEVILTNLLKKDSTFSISGANISKKDSLSKDLYELLASKINLKKELLEDYLELEEYPRLFFIVKRENSLEEQALFLMIYLSILRICYDQNEINSSKLREILAEHQIQSIGNLSSNVKKISRFIIHKSGKIGSTRTFYKITSEGVSHGLDLLSQIIQGRDPKEIPLDFIGRKLTKRNKRASKVGLEIEKLVEEGFFNEPKRSGEVVAEVKKRGFFNRRQDIDAYLRKVLLGKKLIREKTNKKWHYVIKK